MKILITGIAGFVGSTIALALRESRPDTRIFGIDSFIRPGSERNRLRLKQAGIEVRHADLRSQSDLAALPRADYVIDAAANPSVLAGVDGQTSSRQLLEHNLDGTINLLEYCKTHGAGFILLSTSRVYAIEPLARLAVFAKDKAFHPDASGGLPEGVSADGVSENFSSKPPISLYGSTKLASEILALEYSATFGFPAWINRCGVLAGAGQFGRPDQGIFSYWINSYLHKRPLKYIGFGGTGLQTRDCLHPADLAPLLHRQMQSAPGVDTPRIINLGGGKNHAISLAQLSDWCAARYGEHPVAADLTPRPFDIPWMVMDSTLAQKTWGWCPMIDAESILNEIALHAEENADWLEISAP